jgi:hypothetical protein
MQRALGTLDPGNFASPYSNRLRTEAKGGGGGRGETLKRATMAEGRIWQLERELGGLGSGMGGVLGARAARPPTEAGEQPKEDGDAGAAASMDLAAYTEKGSAV